RFLIAFYCERLTMNCRRRKDSLKRIEPNCMGRFAQNDVKTTQKDMYAVRDCRSEQEATRRCGVDVHRVVIAGQIGERISVSLGNCKFACACESHWPLKTLSHLKIEVAAAVPEGKASFGSSFGQGHAEVVNRLDCIVICTPSANYVIRRRCVV